MSSQAPKSFVDRIADIVFGEDDADIEPQRKLAADNVSGRRPLRQGTPLPQKVPAGTMQLIGLTAVRQQLGGEWEDRSSQILRLVDGILRRRLDATDAFYKVDEENYLILFTRLGRQEAAFKAKVIADEIQKIVIGELSGGQDVVVTSTVAAIDRKLVLQRAGSLHDLVTYVRKAAETEAAAAAGEDDTVTFFHQGGEADPELQQNKPVVTGAGPDLADLDQSLAGLFHKKTTAAFLKECQSGFYPAFNIKRRAFSIYHSTVIHVPTGRPAIEVDDPFLENPTDLPFQLDRYTLTTGLLGLHRMLTSGRKGIAIMSVNFDTLAQSKMRDVYFSRLKEVPAGISRFLGMAIHNIPPGTPASRVAEVIAYVQPFCATRVLHIPPDFRLIDIYANTGCHTFSTWVPTDEPDIGKRLGVLSNFAKRASLHRMESVLAYVSTQDDISAAIAAGFSFVEGDAVASIIETPGFAEALKQDHILRQIGSS